MGKGDWTMLSGLMTALLGICLNDLFRAGGDPPLHAFAAFRSRGWTPKELCRERAGVLGVAAPFGGESVGEVVLKESEDEFRVISAADSSSDCDSVPFAGACLSSSSLTSCFLASSAAAILASLRALAASNSRRALRYLA